MARPAIVVQSIFDLQLPCCEMLNDARPVSRAHVVLVLTISQLGGCALAFGEDAIWTW